MIRVDVEQLSPIVAFCDPAGRPKRANELKRVRARTAIVVVGMDSYARKHVLEAIADRWSATQTMERIFELSARWRIDPFGIEANAMQENYADMVADRGRQEGRYLKLVAVHQPTNVDKLWRIRTTLQPVLARGELVIDPARQQELYVELQGFPTGRTVDLVDALASAIDLLPNRTKPATTQAERQKLESYLRRIGVEDKVIRARLERFDHDARAATGGL